MTGKRFEVFKTDTVIGINDNGKSIGNVYTVCDLLNELNDECEFLKIDNEALEDGATKYAELCHKSLKENEQLKKENQKLTEYGRELLEYINAPPKHRKSIFDAVVCFKNKKGDME